MSTTEKFSRGIAFIRANHLALVNEGQQQLPDSSNLVASLLSDAKKYINGGELKGTTSEYVHAGRGLILDGNSVGNKSSIFTGTSIESIATAMTIAIELDRTNVLAPHNSDYRDSRIFTYADLDCSGREEKNIPILLKKLLIDKNKLVLAVMDYGSAGFKSTVFPALTKNERLQHIASRGIYEHDSASLTNLQAGGYILFGVKK